MRQWIFLIALIKSYKQITSMKIFCEDTLTYGELFFSDVADVTWFSGNRLRPEDLVDAEALFVRSTTKVDSELINLASNLKLVATGTSGSDHLDLPLLNKTGIASFVAGGCNAIAVAEYVIAGVISLCEKQQLNIFNKTLGIVGAGYVGTALAERAACLGLKVKLSDPPLEAMGDKRHFSHLDEVLQCDIISLHVPLVKGGQWATFHMLDQHRLANLQPHQILVNACRGEVVDNVALWQLLKDKPRFLTIFDVWENEPNINFELAKLTDIATQHIAGHSIEGKARGTEMIYNFAAGLFNWPRKSMWDYLPPSDFDGKEYSDYVLSGELTLASDKQIVPTLNRLIKGVYDIEKDTELFKTQVLNLEQFRYSRKNYAIRREFASAKVNAGNSSSSKAIYGLGFGSNP